MVGAVSGGGCTAGDSGDDRLAGRESQPQENRVRSKEIREQLVV